MWPERYARRRLGGRRTRGERRRVPALHPGGNADTGSSALRSSSASPRWLGWLSVAFAAGSVALVAQTDGDHLGMWQRLWLANNLAWLLLVAWAATARERVEG